MKFTLQICQHCQSHSWCTRHKQDTYNSLASVLQQNITELGQDVSITRISSYRVGAFQLQCEGKVLFSKLKLGYFPHIDLLMPNVVDFINKKTSSNVKYQKKDSPVKQKTKFQQQPTKDKKKQQSKNQQIKKQQPILQDVKPKKNQPKKEQTKKEQTKKQQKRQQKLPPPNCSFNQFIQNFVSISIDKATNIKGSQLVSKMDPLVVLKISQKTQKTKVAQNAGTSPVFNQFFTFLVQKTDNFLLVSLQESDLITNDHIGQAKLDLQALLSTGPAKPLIIQVKKQGKTTGTIFGNITYYQKKVAKLTVQLKKAQLSIDTQTFGKMDPYAVVEIGDQKYQTQVKENAGKQPVFGQKYDFVIKGDQKELIVKLMQKDTASSDQLGEVVLSIRQLKEGDKKKVRTQNIKKEQKCTGTLQLVTQYISS